jgi:hypothetical protein
MGTAGTARLEKLRFVLFSRRSRLAVPLKIYNMGTPTLLWAFPSHRIERNGGNGGNAQN